MNIDALKTLFNELMLGKISDNAKLWLIKNGFFDVPCSTKYHLNFAGGLAQHSINVTVALLDLTDKLNLTWSRKESPYIIGMFHDLCKIDQYVFDKFTNQFIWNNYQVHQGHGGKSVILINDYICKLTEEETACIRWHMGAFDDKTNWNDYTQAIQKYPNVLYTHTADMIATHIMEKEN